jgi:para-aminobenzoate synthetase component 1
LGIFRAPPAPPAVPAELAGRLVECARLEWHAGDGGDPAGLLERFLTGHGLPVGDLSGPPRSGPPPSRAAAGGGAVAGTVAGAAVLVGAAAAAAVSGAAPGAPSPAPEVPDLVAVVYTAAGRPPPRLAPPPASPGVLPAAPCQVGGWRCTWSDAEHAAAVRAVRAEIARGEVYQVNVVGHRSAPYRGDPTAALAATGRLPGARYAGMLTARTPGDWVVASASPEALVTVAGGVARTRPVKGTRPATAEGRQALLASAKERAEHIMIVDLERNDLGRLAVPGTVRVESLFELQEWCGLWQAESTVAARLRPGTGLSALLRAVLPGGSVTGAPKLAAVGLAAQLEPVGRGPAMGALGFVTPDRVDLGLTIRTVAAARGRLHLWAGGGVTWDSDPAAEVAEAHAKAAPLLAALASGRPSPA